MNIEEAKKKLLEPQKISLVEIIRKFKREGIENFIITRPEIVETLLTAYEKEKEKNNNARERIEYYLVGNFTLNDFDERNKELRKIEKVLEE